MIRFFLLILISVVFVSLAFGQKCNDKTVGNERRVCSHMVVELQGIVTSQIKGVVVDGNEKAIPDSVIEVYEAKEDGKLIATYKTDFEGKFCFKNLPNGKYFLRAGWSRLGFNCTDLKIEIKGKIERIVKIPLEVGT